MRYVFIQVVALITASCIPIPASGQDSSGPTTTHPDLPSEIPAKFEPTRYGFDFERRDVMIPMRDGVKLHTVILVPKGTQRAPVC